VSKQAVTIIDFGVNNILSVSRALEKCNALVSVSSNPDFILKSKKVVFPGIGAFPNAMKSLKSLGLASTIRDIANSGTPMLAICLGMQLLFEESEEFEKTKGLGVISGTVTAIPNLTTFSKPQKIPHIGWNSIFAPPDPIVWKDTILHNNREGEFTYFVHSYQVKPKVASSTLAVTNYGGHVIPAVITHENIVGCQFHPEKSGEVGLKLLKRFVEC